MTSEMIESAWANIGFFLYQLDLEVRRLARRFECLYLKILKKETILGVQPNLRGSLNKFPDFFRMGTFINSTHMKL